MNSKELLTTKEPFLLITGPAGSGKTFIAREAINLNPKFAILTATTGAAARVLSAGVNGECKTIHSTLGFFDAESLRNSRKHGTLRKNMKRLKKQFKRIITDEASMLDCEVFEIIVAECEAIGMGLIIVADFCQLPSIPPKCVPSGWTQWIFNTPSFSKFKVIRLTTQYRQTNTDFIAGLNLLRAGRGEDAIAPLKTAGVKFIPGGVNHPLDLTYNGTTIVGTNNLRGQINDIQYSKLPSAEELFETERSGHWTKEDWQEWKDIPDSIGLKIGTRVMVLRNLYGMMKIDRQKKVDTEAEAVQQVLWNSDGSGGWVSTSTSTAGELEEDEAYAILQANGDTGVVEQFDDEGVYIRRDDGALILVTMMKADNGLYHTEIDPTKGTRVRICDESPTAWVKYLPVTMSWALTVHKSQGLTLDHPTRVVCESFFGKPAMVYVAISRVKNPKDLTIVAAEDIINDSPWLHWLCKMDGHCTEWL